MTFEDNHSFCVNKHDVWDSSHSILLAAIRCSSVIVNWSFPVLSIYMFNNSFSCLVDTQTNNFHLITPFVSSFLEHFLIVCHWSLTWRAPSSPKINHPNLAFFMFEVNRITTSNRYHILNCFILASRTKLGSDFN